ncbi:MAG TPA: PH domain-containing protein [Anaerolineales bacterium]|nr:PH domain-containing protein [Anaerolineales bacterium]
MGNYLVFRPDRRQGIVFHAVVILILASIGVWGVFQLTRAEIGPLLLVYILPTLLVFILLPLFIYRAFALYRAGYALGRDGIQLHWGLRVEDVPMDKVEWVKPAQALEAAVPLPQLRWPGSILGVQRLPGGNHVEFMASSTNSLILISTSAHTYAVSPDDPHEFLDAYRRYAELGSLAPIPARSVYPSLFLVEVWRARPTRYLLLSGVALSLILLVWVSFLIPARSTIPFGFNPDGSPGGPVPSGQLLLLPVINGFFFLTDTFLGLFFYRRHLNAEMEGRADNGIYQIMAYLLWGSGVIAALLFLSAVYLML